MKGSENKIERNLEGRADVDEIRKKLHAKISQTKAQKEAKEKAAKKVEANRLTFYVYVTKIKNAKLEKENFAYMLKVLAARARLLNITYTEFVDVLIDLKEHYDLTTAGNDTLDVKELEHAVNNFASGYKFTNKTVLEKTGIDLTMLNTRKMEQAISRVVRQIEHEERIAALKRYAKKGYTVEKMVRMLDGIGLKTSKATLYSCDEYRFIVNKGIAQIAADAKKHGKLKVKRVCYLKEGDENIYQVIKSTYQSDKRYRKIISE